MEPKVTLISCTADPIRTINMVWDASRHNDPLITNNDPDLFQKVIESQIPVAEMIDFVFLLENVSIAFREQMVRHRIGVKVGDRIGADIAPDLAESSWWSQSMRILDMGNFYSNDAYEVPKTVAALGQHIVNQYDCAMERAQKAYQNLVELGVPMEDARMVIPLAATHRIVWKLNLMALMHIVGKRGCWILQLGFWEPIIRGMIEELATKINPLFRNLINPPCIKGGCFKECAFKLDNERRIQGEDEIPPCPLFLHHHSDLALKAQNTTPVEAKDAKKSWFWDGNTKDWKCWSLEKHFRMERMRGEYSTLWGRNVDNGEKLKLGSEDAFFKDRDGLGTRG